MRKMTAEERDRFEQEATYVLNALHEKAREEIEQGNEIPAMIYVMLENGDVEFVMLQEAMDAGKDVAEALIKGIQRTPGVMGTVFMSEAWMTEIPKEDMESGKPLPIPSEDPNRKEAVVWVVETPVGDLFARALVARNPNHLGDLDVPKFDPDTMQTEGRFVGGFRGKTPALLGKKSSVFQSHFDHQLINKGKS